MSKTQQIDLCVRCAERANRAGYVENIYGGSVCAWCRNVATLRYMAWVAEPHETGTGVPWCSTSTELVRVPEIVWDVNGYYRALGVPTSASRKDIRRAYQRLSGQDDWWLTMAVSVLLGSERIRYDAMPLGQLYLDEALRLAWVRKQLQDREGSLVIERRERVEIEAPGWGWWSWQAPVPDEGGPTMEEWRSLVVRELAERRVAIRLAVGWHAKGSHRAVVMEVAPGVIGALLHNDYKGVAPTPGLAATVAEQIASALAGS